MMSKNISRREQSMRAEAKYYYSSMDRPSKGFTGETVDEFLARGGTIKVIDKSAKQTPSRSESGKFVKSAPIV